MLFAPIEVDDPKTATVAIRKPLRDTYPWLEAIVAQRRSTALAETRRVYLEPRVQSRSTDAATRKFQRLRQLKERVDGWHRMARARILRCWAQQGLEKFDGMTIATSFKARLAYLSALGGLPPAVRKRVTCTVEVFDLGAFLALAESGEIDRAIVARHIIGDLGVEVRRVA